MTNFSRSLLALSAGATLMSSLSQADQNESSGLEKPKSISYELSAIASYTEASSQILVLDKRASFRAGGIGLKFGVEHATLGSLYASWGGGYSPRESASFLGAEVDGPADSEFFGIGYAYKHQFDSQYAIGFQSDYVSYDIGGDFAGERQGVPVTAQIDSDISLTDLAVSLHYSKSPQLRFRVGLGASHWSIDATADGTLGSSIRASTDAGTDGWDGLLFLGAETDLFGFPLDLRYKWSQINGDNSVVVHGLDIELGLVF
jgi:hypothetical protein